MTGTDMPETLSPDEARILADIDRGRCHAVELQFTDVSGSLKGVALPASQARGVLTHGHWFDGSALEGNARLAETDLRLFPDGRTWAIIPWGTGPTVARAICDIRTPDGSQYPAAPRAVLARAVDAALEVGLHLEVASEIEFFVFRVRPDGSRIPVDRAGYFDTNGDAGGALREEVSRALEAMGIAVDGTHHELAPGQHEIDLPPMPAVAAADAIVTAKYVVKSLARMRGLAVTFMPKPLEGVAGSGLHLHQGVTMADGSDALADPIDEYGLSATGRGWIGGQLAHARAACAVLAPQVNSYKRIGRGFDAPSAIAWSRRDPSAMLHVARPVLARKRVGGRRPVLVEIRHADPSCNPYLALAVAIAAGLDGVREGLDVPPPLVAGDPRSVAADALPVSLGEALTELAWDGIVRDALGTHVHDRLITVSEQEWQAYKSHVTAWEVARSFDPS
ncbi:MAG: glutamine synthetase family protein [Chloroflexi bacterium]|nr:glutamine synthetase family protein [Chloroflexota bacterium]